MSAASIGRFWPGLRAVSVLEAPRTFQFEVVQLLSTVGVKMLVVDLCGVISYVELAAAVAVGKGKASSRLHIDSTTTAPSDR
jgi:hypothetical protein